MISSQWLEGRKILSFSYLPDIIKNNWSDDYLQMKAYGNAFFYTSEALGLQNIHHNIKRGALSLVRQAQGNLSDLPNGVMYEKLNEKQWHCAAMIIEIFRNSTIAKNADKLNTLVLQKKFYGLLCLNKISFIIGWGQPKRSCGGIKTSGPYADLCEFYATARLQMIAEAIYEISKKKVDVISLTGGSRFYEAFFTPPKLTEEYDRQRNIIASYLKSENCKVIYKPYNDKGFERDEIFKKKIEEVAHLVDDVAVQQYMNTILLNICWDEIISSDPSLSPHGIELSAKIKNMLLCKDEKFKLLLIRAGIVGILSPETYNKWEKYVEDMDVFDDLLSFMYHVSIKSTRKYIAIHQIDSDIDKPTIDRGLTDIFRMTVHEKKDRHDIPAIFLLGNRGGDLLPQHVVAYIDEQNQASFMTNLEVSQKEAIPVFYQGEEREDVLFSWLKCSKQPLFYTNHNNKDISLIFEKMLFTSI